MRWDKSIALKSIMKDKEDKQQTSLFPHPSPRTLLAPPPLTRNYIRPIPLAAFRDKIEGSL